MRVARLLLPDFLRSSIWLVERPRRAASSLPRAYATDNTPGDPLLGGTIEQIRNKIFGNRTGNNLRSGAKVLRKKLVGEKVANYYLKPIEKEDPLHVDLRAERMTGKLEKLKRRGKAPPKKGQGKRASKKK